MAAPIPLPPRPRAVLLDALGTLVALRPPAPALRRELGERAGISVSVRQAERAVRREIAYYRAHLMEARDAASLADLRRRCAAEVLAELGADPAPDLAPVEAALLAALRFVCFPEVPGALARLRRAGIRLVVVSNWDVSLHDVLASTGLAALVDGAVASAEVGWAKPHPEPFVRGLALAGASPGEAVHAGDSLREDVEGARAAGLAGVLVARAGQTAPTVAAVPDLQRLAELLGA